MRSWAKAPKEIAMRKVLSLALGSGGDRSGTTSKLTEGQRQQVQAIFDRMSAAQSHSARNWLNVSTCSTGYSLRRTSPPSGSRLRQPLLANCKDDYDRYI